MESVINLTKMYNKKRVKLIVKEWFELKTGIVLSNKTLRKLVDDITECKQCDIPVVSQRSELFALLNWMKNEPQFSIDDIDEILDDYAFYKANCG